MRFSPSTDIFQTEDSNIRLLINGTTLEAILFVVPRPGSGSIFIHDGAPIRASRANIGSDQRLQRMQILARPENRKRRRTIHAAAAS